jgi:hypothetical protein
MYCADYLSILYIVLIVFIVSFGFIMGFDYVLFLHKVFKSTMYIMSNLQEVALTCTLHTYYVSYVSNIKL